LSFLKRIFGDRSERAALRPLYDAIVAAGRDPGWYGAGQVPDTLDGRFDMIAALIALVLLRLEAAGDAGRAPSVLLTEIFIDDMDATLRQIGVGDYVVGKHVGRMMSALGGRLGALREGRTTGDLTGAVRRNVFHDAPPSEAVVAWVAARLGTFADALAEIPVDDLVAGQLRAP
jgi:cytochrome b pre-mRNA-processing protein 3